MSEMGKGLVLVGLVVAGVGLLSWLGPKIPWFGRLPGDMAIERPHFRFYFPLATCVLLSALATLVLWLIKRR